MATPKVVLVRDSRTWSQYLLWIPCSDDAYGYWFRTELGIPFVDAADMAAVGPLNVRAMRQVVVGRVHKGLMHSWNNSRISSEAGTSWTTIPSTSMGDHGSSYVRFTQTQSKNVFIGKLPAGFDRIEIRHGNAGTGFTDMKVYADAELIHTFTTVGAGSTSMKSQWITVTPSASDRVLSIKTPAEASKYFYLHSVSVYKSTELANPADVDTAYFADGKWQGNDIMGYLGSAYVWGRTGGKKVPYPDTFEDAGILCSANTLEPNINFTPNGGSAGWCTIGWHFDATPVTGDLNRFTVGVGYYPSLLVDGTTSYDLTAASGAGGAIDWDEVISADTLRVVQAGTNASATSNWFTFITDIDYRGVQFVVHVVWATANTAYTAWYGTAPSGTKPGGGSDISQYAMQPHNLTKYPSNANATALGSEWYVYVDGVPGYMRIENFGGPGPHMRTLATYIKIYTGFETADMPVVNPAVPETCRWTYGSRLTVHAYDREKVHPQATRTQRI